MLNILFVENDNLNDNPMSTCYPLKCSKIKQITFPNINLTYYDISTPLNLDLSVYDIVLFGCRSIYLYKVYKASQRQPYIDKFNQLMQIKKRFMLIQDMHPKTYGSIDELSKLLNDHYFNIIFTFWENTEARAIRTRTPNCKHFHLPHHIDTNIFKIHDQNDIANKSIDILLFGSVHPRHYPFRKRLFDLILANKDVDPKLNVYYIPYDSSTYNPAHCEKGLSKLLNKSKLCIATKSRYDYLVGKYFEISSSGCLIAGDIPTDGRELLKDNILELNQSMTDDEIINKIRDCLNNYSENIDKINNFKIKVDSVYNLDKYIEKLIQIITENNQ